MTYDFRMKYHVEVMVRTDDPHPGEMVEVYERYHRELPDAMADARQQQIERQAQHPGRPVLAHVSMQAEGCLHLGWFEDCDLSGDPFWNERDDGIFSQLRERIVG